MCHLTWIGDGPYNSYPGQTDAAERGIWHVAPKPVTDPENRYYEGNRANVDLAVVTDGKGNGIGVICNSSTVSLEETSIHIGRLVFDGAIPFEAAFFHESQRLTFRRCVSRNVPMNASTLAAMAIDYVVQSPMNFVLHCTAQASTRGSRRSALVFIHFCSSFHLSYRLW